jgi:mono/diheme cytochrome c family protein
MAAFKHQLNDADLAAVITYDAQRLGQRRRRGAAGRREGPRK